MENYPEIQTLVSLGKSFADKKMFDEALEVFELASKLAPEEISIQLAIADTKRRKNQYLKERSSLTETLKKEIKREIIDAQNMCSLAHFFFTRGEFEKVNDYLQPIIENDLPLAEVYLLLGKMQMKVGDNENAILYLQKARVYHPFDPEIPKLLGDCYRSLKNNYSALEHYLIAYIVMLQSGIKDKNFYQLREIVNDLKTELDLTGNDLSKLLHKCADELSFEFERVNWHKDIFSKNREAKSTKREGDKGTFNENLLLSIANTLRENPIFSKLTDDEIVELSKIAEVLRVSEGEVLINKNSDSRDLYLLLSGELVVQVDSPYGKIALAKIKQSEFVGEVNFIQGGKRSADVAAEKDCELIRFPYNKLISLLESRSSLSLKFYKTIWNFLSSRLRRSTDQLKTFFDVKEKLSQDSPFSQEKSVFKQSVLDLSKAQDIFKEQGLNIKELKLIAKFAEERIYPEGSYIFREGDVGEEMYIVASGKVLISRTIEEVGEEALAIVDRGHLFGEMSVIDNKPRNADAKAHDGPATVIAIKKETINNVISNNPESGTKFLKILCNIIAKRLREIDEKLISWRIMSGKLGSKTD